MTVPDDATQPNPATQKRRLSYKALRNWAIAVSALMICVMTAITVYCIDPYFTARATAKDAYSDWPAFVTRLARQGESIVHANAIVVFTCQNGKTHIDQRMLQDTPKLRKGVQPDWFVEFFVRYNEADQNHCGLSWSPLSADTRIIQLNHAEGTGDWTMTAGGWSYNGMSSALIRKGTKGITALLLQIADKRVPQGPVIPYGENGLLNPSKDLIKP